MARGPMPRHHLAQRGHVVVAARHHVRAARMEVAARRRIDRARHIPREDHPLAPPRAGLRDRHRRQQRLGVRMQRHLEQAGLVGGLDDAAQIHHRHAVADVLHHRQIVRDEQIGQLELVLQVHQQIDDLRLDRHVQRRHRLVADDQLRTQRQRAGDADALALAAGELVRERGHVLGSQTDALEQVRDAFLPFRAGADVVDDQRLADDVARRHARVQRCVGILVDHLHLLADTETSAAYRDR